MVDVAVVVLSSWLAKLGHLNCECECVCVLFAFFSNPLGDFCMSLNMPTSTIATATATTAAATISCNYVCYELLKYY